MQEYRKVKKIQRLSCLVGCLNRFSSGNIEIILISIHLIIIIFCIMNIFIIPWKILKNIFFPLRIVILAFLIISLICLGINLIFRRAKKLKFGYYYIGFYCSIICIGLIILDFLLILFPLYFIIKKVKEYTEQKYDYKSILAIDIFSLLILIIMLFLWYSEILNVYAKLNFTESLKEYIDSKLKFYLSQNAKIVTIEQGGKIEENCNDEGIPGKNMDYDDIISTNKAHLSVDKPIEDRKIDNSIRKSNDISNSINK
jgi:hypothetical protein